MKNLKRFSIINAKKCLKKRKHIHLYLSTNSIRPISILASCLVSLSLIEKCINSYHTTLKINMLKSSSKIEM